MKKLEQKLAANVQGFKAGTVWSLLVGAALWFYFGPGFANFDALYSLLWGQEILSGQLPDYSATLSPTPHPLSNLIATALAPFGSSSETILVAFSYLLLGTASYLLFRIGTLYISSYAGLVAAAVFLTREPILSYGLRAYVDIPYLVLLLTALLVELKRPKAGAPVVILLILAGLLRPEAWLFLLCYILYIAIKDSPKHAFKLATLSLLSPAVWLLSDWIASGNPLLSFTETRTNSGRLERPSGIDAVFTVLPRRIGEVLREPVLIGSFIGVAVGLRYMRDKTTQILTVIGLAAFAFVAITVAGLPALTRYSLATSTGMILLFALTTTGFCLLPSSKQSSQYIWRGIALTTALLFTLFMPQQFKRIQHLQSSIKTQHTIGSDLKKLLRNNSFAVKCGPIVTPNHRMTPLIALTLNIKPSGVRSAQHEPSSNGYFLTPATPTVAKQYILDKRDLQQPTIQPPKQFELIAENSSWKLYRNCNKLG